tara:strand:- start:186 stop:1166 length:981 start_codon:yes stop_codon:yes gene_type:complete
MNFNNEEMEQLLEEAFQQVMSEGYPQFTDNLHNVRSTDTDSSYNIFPRVYPDILNSAQHIELPPIIQNIVNSVEERLRGSIQFQQTNPSNRSETSETQTDTLNEQSNETHSNSNPNSNSNSNSNPTLPMSQSRNHYIDVLNDLLQSYNNNFRLYQQNTTIALRQLQSINRHHYSSSSRTRASSSPPQQSRTNINSWFQPLLSNMGIELEGGIIGTGPFSGVFPASSNIHSIPTIRQFACATEPLRYDSSLHSVNISCPITLEEFQDNEFICRIKQCRHIFKVQPLQNWFSRNSYCPVCRYDIRTWNELPTSTTNEQLHMDTSNNDI